MQADLTKRMRKAREEKVTVDKFTFKFLRPTVAEAIQMQAKGVSHLEIARQFVNGWEGVTEADVVNSGTTDPLEFDREVWSMWLDDSPEFWLPIGDAVFDAYNRFANSREDAVKN